MSDHSLSSFLLFSRRMMLFSIGKPHFCFLFFITISYISFSFFFLSLTFGNYLQGRAGRGTRFLIIFDRWIDRYTPWIAGNCLACLLAVSGWVGWGVCGLGKMYIFGGLVSQYE